MKVWIDLLEFAASAAVRSGRPAAGGRGPRGPGHRPRQRADDRARAGALAHGRGDRRRRARERRAAKVATLGERIRDLRRWAARVGPDVALSHNSYAQIVAARSLRIPAVTAMDFEHQPANHVAFRLATTVLVPEMLPLDVDPAPGRRAREGRALSGSQGGALHRRLQTRSRDPGQGRGRSTSSNRRRGANSADPCRLPLFLEPVVRTGASRPSARRRTSSAWCSRATPSRSPRSNVSGCATASSPPRRSIPDRWCTPPT